MPRILRQALRTNAAGWIACCALLISIAAHASARQLRLPTLLTDGAVLQREKPLTLHGWATPGADVAVRLGRKSGTTTAAADGTWQLTLAAQRAAGPLTLTVVSGDESVEVHDVWLGDVWLVSGQSNIDTHIERVYPQYKAEIDADSTGRVRLFQVANTVALDGIRDDVRSNSRWQPLSRTTAWHFSAIGYFLGKRMAATTGVAQGIIQSSWGGTPIEAWLPQDSVETIVPAMAAEARYYADDALNGSIAAANAAAAARWSTLLDESDPGVADHWADEGYDDSAWTAVSQYALPTAGNALCGSYWARQRFDIDAAHAGQTARLLLGTLIDADFTYVNGRLVGHTGYQYPPRRYDIPAGVLHEGQNTIVVRFVNHGTPPTFVREKPYRLEFADGTQVALAQTWRVHDGTQMPKQPSMPMGNQNSASALWNAMLAPLAPLTLAGAVWYQGESNTDRPVIYERELTALMHTWRTRLGQPTLPFAIVQLAGYMAPSAEPQESGWPRLRESQRRAAAADAYAEVVPAHDLGETYDIHPLRKKEVAARAADVMDRLVFGKKDVRLCPKPVRAEVVAATDGGCRLRVTFDQRLRPGDVHGFEVAAADAPFHNVAATAEGNSVSIDIAPSANGAATTFRIRYAWKNNPVEADCAAEATALPAVPFELSCEASDGD